MAAVLSLPLAGCATQFDVFSTLPEPRDSNTEKYFNDNYEPMVFKESGVKSGFRQVLSEICKASSLSLVDRGRPANRATICEKSTQKTDFNCWAANNSKAQACVNAVTRHAVNQCVALVGRQNRFASITTRFFFPIQALFGLVADAAIIANASSNSAATALAAAALANSATVQKSVPGTTSTKTPDLVSSGQGYVLLANFEDKDIDDLQDPEATGDALKVARKYSELHDAVLATCNANNLTESPHW
jgi:hypothetical protein